MQALAARPCQKKRETKTWHILMAEMTLCGLRRRQTRAKNRTKRNKTEDEEKIKIKK